MWHSSWMATGAMHVVCRWTQHWGTRQAGARWVQQTVDRLMPLTVGASELMPSTASAGGVCCLLHLDMNAGPLHLQ